MRRRIHALSVLPFLPALLSPTAVASQSSSSAQLLRASTIDGGDLRGGVWAYDIVVRLEGEEQQVGTRVLIIDPVEHGSRPGWLLVEVSRSGGTEVVDSLVLDRETLSLRRR